MREVEMAAHQIIDMVTVRDGLMAAAGAMVVTGLMPVTGMGRRAGGRVRRTDGEHMLIHVIVM